jgi:type VI secretion system protein ImpG
LAARVHLKLDAEFPRFTQGLLETVYPEYLCPIPSMGIVRFEPQPREEALAEGVVIPRGTLLRSQVGRGERTACTFSTAHPVRLLPLALSEVRYFVRDLAELNLPPELGARAALRLRLEKTVPLPFGEIRVDPLLVHIRGADELPGQLYEAIFGHRRGLVVQSGTPPQRCGPPLPSTAIRRVGLLPNEALLPPAPQSFEGYRLLREYFVFPQRFLFFELQGFGEALAQATGDFLDLVLVLNESDPRLEGRLDKTSLDLFCAPVVNLFEKTLDRIAVSERLSDFHVVPDRNRPLDFEIYQLNSVTGFGEKPDDEQRFLPFYQARDTEGETNAFYTLQRVPRMFSDRERISGRRSSYAGTDAFISIVDGDMAPCRTTIRQLGLRALCTNRHLPIQMAKGVSTTDFTMDIAAPVVAIRLILGPTLPRPSLVLAGQNPERPDLPSGRFAWRLISHLSLNYLSLLDSNPQGGAEALREILRLYADPNDRQARKQIDGLRHLHHQPIVRRVETPGPITFARGLEIKLTFDEASFEGQGVFVLGSVLEQFLQKYVALNSFVETVISTQQRQEIMRWPAQMGRRQIL